MRRSYCDTCRKSAARKKKLCECVACEYRRTDLLPENREAWTLLQASTTQVRIGGMGQIVGFDYPAVKLVANAYGIILAPALFRKLQAVESIMRKSKPQPKHNQTTPSSIG